LGTKGGSSTDILKRRIKELECSIEHFGNTAKPSSNIKYTLDEILIENSSYANITCLKSRLIKENRLEYKCDCCGNNGEWLGKKLVLQLDHINGINNDHRIENLRFLCPNCHSQTDTFCTRQPRAKSEEILQ
jgi:Zn finger protein HypA/HybF involved in hydrogenase expression